MEIALCSNPWCKAQFRYNELEEVPKSERTDKINDIIEESDEKVYRTVLPPKQCPKCISFDQDLSGGVTWSEKKYEGSRWDGQPHEIAITIKNYGKDR